MNKLLALVAASLVCAAALAQTASGDGEVTKVDPAAARITIKHSGLKALDMPPMALAFKVSDPRMLGKATVGDKVRFTAEKVSGSYTLTAIEKAP